MVDGEMGGLDSFYLGQLYVLSLDWYCFLSFDIVDVMPNEISHYNKTRNKYCVSYFDL